MISKYFSGVGKVIYSYSYSINGNGCKGKVKHYGIGQLNERLIGKDFLVLCNIDDPEKNAGILIKNIEIILLNWSCGSM